MGWIQRKSRYVFVICIVVLGIVLSNMAFVHPASAANGGEYRQYLSDRSPSGSQMGWGSLRTDANFDGAKLSLKVQGVEHQFDKGLLAHAHSYIYYNDIQDYGYERFESWVGIDKAKRQSAKASVQFRVYGDGQLLWQSSTMNASSEAEHVSVDISQVHVLKLEADALGGNQDDHAVWGDAAFYKSSATPYLSAADKEFSTPEQVTAANILEGVFARTLSGPVGPTPEPVKGVKGELRNGKEGNDLSDAVTYTTNYQPGKTGDFSITYRVQDAQGLVRTRTVKMTVQGTERYRTNADIDYLTTPFASYLYSGRDFLDEQGKKAFDLIVDTLLHFGRDVNKYPVITRWNERVAQVDINLQAAGIYMSTADAKYFTALMYDDEPRLFLLKEWAPVVTAKEGMASVATFYVPERYTKDDYYNKRLLATEGNASRFIAKYEKGMTDAQTLRAVLYPYADWIKYNDYGGWGGQTMDQALAEGKGVCGGNARGAIYLSQRLGIKAYWVRTASHAWSIIKLNETGKYYRVDLLARDGCFLSVDGGSFMSKYHGHHHEVYFDRSKGYPDMTDESYPFQYTQWPNLSLEVSQDINVLVPSDSKSFQASSLITKASSVYDGNVIGKVSIDDGGLAAKATDAGYTPGFYTLTYSVKDSRGNTATAKGYVQVINEGTAVGKDPSSHSGSYTFRRVGLWTGNAERWYDNGIWMNEKVSLTYDIAGKGYRYFDAWVGIEKEVRDNTSWGRNGKVRLEVWATVDGKEEQLYTSPDMGWYAVQQHALVKIPEGATAITLKNTPLGSGNNHAGWGNPRFFTDDILDTVPVPPSFAGVEDGAVYEQAVTPEVEHATEVSLYRKDLPTVVEPAAAQSVDLVTVGSVASTADGDVEDYGELVAGWKSGTPISGEGRYTIVASNNVGQTSKVSFQIGVPKPQEPAIPDTPVMPEVSGVRDGATYTTAPKPYAKNANTVTLYRRDLPADGEASPSAAQYSARAASFVRPASVRMARMARVMMASQEDAAADETGDGTQDDAGYGSPVDGWSNGDPITENGMYTLVAEAPGGTVTTSFEVRMASQGSGDVPGGDGDTGGSGSTPGGNDEQAGGSSNGQQQNGSSGNTVEGQSNGSQVVKENRVAAAGSAVLVFAIVALAACAVAAMLVMIRRRSSRR